MRDIDPLNTSVGERLRALPQEAEPYGWEEFRRRSTRTHRYGGRGAAAEGPALRAAAAILLIAGATAWAAWFGGRSELSADRPVAARSSSPTAAPIVEPGDRSESLNARARAAELWLARQPADPAMVRVGAYAAVAGLEDRIAQLDDLLTSARAEGVQPASLSPLETQRARLVSSLAQVRFAETLVANSSP